MPPCLACYLIRALSNLTHKIQKIANSLYWPKMGHFCPSWAWLKLTREEGRSDVTASFAYKNSAEGMCQPGSQVPNFQIFGLKLLSTFSRLDNKLGGIL